MNADVTQSTVDPNEEVPVGNIQGFKRYFANDIVSGLIVFLIALPLCLAIASGAGFPPVAGVLTAIVGAVVAPWISNSELTIKGPAAGLLMIMAGAYTNMEEIYGAEGAYSAALAIGLAAGIIQIFFGLFKSGFISEFFPTAIVHGMLAAIGVIIISKQFPKMLGAETSAHEPLALLLEIPNELAHINPRIALIGVSSLAMLALLTRFGKPITRFVPAQMIVLIAAIPMAWCMGFNEPHSYQFAGLEYNIDHNALVEVPGSFLSSIQFPNFEALANWVAWKWVLMYAIIGSLESVLSSKAIDMLDPYRRKTNMNRDLLAIGVGNTVAACIGGLPMISEIVRSKANIDNGAKTRFANFWHGIFLLVSIALLARVVHLIPMPALAAMLVFTGARLASPSEFLHMYRIGKEQLVFFVLTMFAVLATDLLIGIVLGVAAKLIFHWMNGVPGWAMFKPHLDVETSDDGTLIIHALESAVFSNWIPFRKQIKQLSNNYKGAIAIDLSQTMMVDQTVMEKLHELQKEFIAEGRSFEIIGLEAHLAAGNHPMSARKHFRMSN